MNQDLNFIDYDASYDIRMAELCEIPEIMEYINRNWREGHILAQNRPFFEYEHVIDNKVNFIIAKEKKSGDIKGILGILPASKDSAHLDVWTVVWKVSDGVIPFLGMELMRRVQKITRARTSLGVGDNPNTTIRLLKLLTNYKCDKMKHYYILSSVSEFHIAKVEKRVPFIYNKEDKTEIKRIISIGEIIGNFDFEKYKEIVPYKDSWYLEKRFFKHPIYKYQVWGLRKEGETEIGAILVTRVEKYKDRAVLRIIDFLGEHELFAGLGEFFNNLIQRYEYIDFYTLGFEEEYIYQAGFTERTKEDTNVIPDYFHPFVQENIDIWCDSSTPNCIFFKGDADQDRPN